MHQAQFAAVISIIANICSEHCVPAMTGGKMSRPTIVEKREHVHLTVDYPYTISLPLSLR